MEDDESAAKGGSGHDCDLKLMLLVLFIVTLYS